MCKTILLANNQLDKDYWLRAFPTTLQGIAIDWFSKLEDKHIESWDSLKNRRKFKLPRDNNEIVAEIYNTKQGKHENIRAI